jgi:NADH dehydrogenase [ubiquinone] 1 alpha subcomplex assembly factor 7
VSERPLSRKLRLLIEANGPMTIAEYMSHCLGDPAHGYYMTRDPFGAAGDFVTAPEVSQIFGEIVGAWLIEAWRLSGSPSPARLVELGPGRGTLMADILRVGFRVPQFFRAVTVHFVETSPFLKKRQQETVNRFAAPIAWHESFYDVPEGSLFLIANEFFDALPIRQLVRVEGQWRERVVGLDQDGRLAFGLGPPVLDNADALAPPGSLAAREESETVLEIRPGADALMTEVATRIVARSGAALIIDYGHATDAPDDTLQAMRSHGFADPLALPGDADITAHVDFAALRRASCAAGAAVHGPITQRDFLLPLGLLERAAQLAANADNATRQALRADVDRLAAADQMGTLFKVMAVTQRNVRPAPFL